ncbi:MAG TPA: PilZ domain-containing protein [Kofleriaceae bacterium]|nr:PilZ domain-containing protein [Kofleriaceae bacterium]
MGVDQRIFPRYAVEAHVELVASSGDVISGVSRNLSRGGLCLESGEEVPAGEEVDVRITLVFDVDRTSEPLRLPARVVWCTPLGDAHQIGTQFRPLTFEQSTYLDMFLRYLEEPARIAAREAEEKDGGDEDDPFAA